MQCRINYNYFILGCFFSLLTIIATTAIAGDGSYQSSPQYSPPVMNNQYGSNQQNSRQFMRSQVNPWQLPQETVRVPGFERLPKYQNQPYQSDQQAGQYQNNQNQMGRFVTPEILESLKRQQMQTQQMPGNKQQYQRQAIPYQPVMDGYGGSSYGMNNFSPLYDEPAVSPWGNGSDVLYRGESFPGSAPGAFPWVPNEAMGGLPPMHVPAFGESDNVDVQNPDNVFNPFNFMPNRGIK